MRKKGGGEKRQQKRGRGKDNKNGAEWGLGSAHSANRGDSAFRVGEEFSPWEAQGADLPSPPLLCSSLCLIAGGGRDGTRTPPPGLAPRPRKRAQGVRKGRARGKLAPTAVRSLPAVPCPPRQFTRLRNFFVSRYSRRLLPPPQPPPAPPFPPGGVSRWEEGRASNSS